MDEEQVTPESPAPAAEPAKAPEQPSAAASAAAALAEAWKGGGAGNSAPAQQQQQRQDRPPRPQGQGGGERRESRPPREGGSRPQGSGERREGRPGGDRPQGDRGPRPEGRPEGRDRREGGFRPGGRPDGFGEIELDKLINDSLYLDNQAHAVVSRMRDMDSGTRSQLRRLYGAVRRATRAPESERQHEFVMLRARLAYTIARHGLRSLDQIERLLLQVTRKNEARGYERFRDLFEAVVAYNE
jgi:CRISPR type III-A-associated protein Csm2